MTEWDQYVAYSCRHPSCQSKCINRVDSAPAQTKQCRRCYSAHDPEALVPLTHHLPDSAAGQPAQSPPSLD